MNLFSSNPLKMIEKIQADLKKLHLQLDEQNQERRKFLIEIEADETGVGVSVGDGISKIEAKIAESHKQISRKDDALSEVKTRHSEFLAEKEHDEYVAKVKKVRDELMPAGLKCCRESEKFLQLSIQKWIEARRIGHEALDLGLKMDCGRSSSKLTDVYLIDSLKLTLRKYGNPYLKQIRPWLDKESKIPAMTENLKEGFAHLLKYHQDIK